jgi:phage FluMu protein Com
MMEGRDMTPIRIACPTCNRVLMMIESEAPVKITADGIVNVRCPKCMDWKNVLEQLRAYRPEPLLEEE